MAHAEREGVTQSRADPHYGSWLPTQMARAEPESVTQRGHQPKWPVPGSAALNQ
jgi:hypothetical protein